MDENGALVDRAADNIPIMQWPDGRWCHDANTYLRELYQRNLSRRNRGGSLSVVAAHITHLLRYCWNTTTDLIALSDNQFTEFMVVLAAEMREGRADVKARDANTTIAIGRDCLGLLQSVALKHADPSLIGPTGRIRAQKKEYTVRPEGGDGSTVVTRMYWDHPSFPEPDPKRRRLPIESASIEKLRDAIYHRSRDPHQRARRRAMLLLLEVTGPRRGEVAEIEMSSVRRAASMKYPMLKAITLKKGKDDPPTRYIPISKADALALLDYAEVYRRNVIRRVWKKADHGKLLISIRTGAPLRPNSITQEIKMLAKAARISQVICPHMFRHRFITKIFVALIERHQISNPDEFRRALLSSEKLKQQVLEWTGHSSIKSLDRYIHLAFEEVAQYKKVYEHVRVNAAIDSFTSILQDEMNRLAEDSKPLKSAHRLHNLVAAFREDLLRTLHSASADEK